MELVKENPYKGFMLIWIIYYFFFVLLLDGKLYLSLKYCPLSTGSKLVLFLAPPRKIGTDAALYKFVCKSATVLYSTNSG